MGGQGIECRKSLCRRRHDVGSIPTPSINKEQFAASLMGSVWCTRCDQTFSRRFIVWVFCGMSHLMFHTTTSSPDEVFACKHWAVQFRNDSIRESGSLIYYE